MKFMVRSNYLIFPVYTRATKKKLIVSCFGRLVFELELRLDHTSPDFYAYIDVSLFKGEFLEISVEPEMPIGFSESDEMPNENRCWDAVRPRVHFSVKSGWMGAPEALFRTEKEYVLIYPHNPADVTEGNGHWGYATSPDLIHWTEKPNALLPIGEERALRRQALVSIEEARDLRLRGKEERTDIFALTPTDGEQLWCTFCGNGNYLVGDCKNGTFKPKQREKKLRYGASACKSVTYADTKTGRVIHLEWDACRATRFSGQMSVPMELSLEKEGDGYTLSATPAEELQMLYKNANLYENLAVSKGKDITVPLADAAHLIRFKGKNDGQAVLRAVLFGRELILDLAHNRAKLGEKDIPLSIKGEELELSLVIDRSGWELFADGGRIYCSCVSEETFMDRNLLSLILRSDTGYCLDLLEIHAMESIF
jgi:sucrose-6-phosphate hydrolase SacC (GH32 family)